MKWKLLVGSMLLGGSAHTIRPIAVALLLALVAILPVSGHAQSDSPFPSPAEEGVSTEGDAPLPEEPGPRITVSRSACRALVRHVPDDDVAYKPGVDVHGRKVAPADLNGGSNILTSLPKEIEFPVTLDFFEYSGIAVPNGISGDQNIGRITYRKGRVYFNDQPLGNEAISDELIDACRAAGFR